MRIYEPPFPPCLGHCYCPCVASRFPPQKEQEDNTSKHNITNKATTTNKKLKKDPGGQLVEDGEVLEVGLQPLELDLELDRLREPREQVLLLPHGDLTITGPTLISEEEPCLKQR